jgi:hypothetical protein
MGCHTWRRVTVKYAGILSSSSPPCVHELHFNNTMSLHNGTWLRLTAISSLHHIIFQYVLTLVSEYEKPQGLASESPKTFLQSYFHCLGFSSISIVWYSDAWTIIVMF